MADFTAGNVLTAAQLDTAFNTYTIRDVSTTSATLGAADAGGLLAVNNNSGGTVTIPLNSTWAAETGTHVHIVNAGTAGSWAIGTAVGVTLSGPTTTLAFNAAATVYKTATDTWRVLPFSSGSAAPVVSGTTGSPTTSTVTLSGVSGTLYDFSANGTFTCTAGRARVVAIGGGGGWASTNFHGSGGGVFDGWVDFTAAAHTITIGAGSGNNAAGGSSKCGSICGANGGATGLEIGAGYWLGGASTAGVPSDITGSSVTYGDVGSPGNYGDGGTNGVSGINGRVFIFVPS